MTLIIPLRDVNTVEKTENPVGGEYINALVVTTKGRVGNRVDIIELFNVNQYIYKHHSK